MASYYPSIDAGWCSTTEICPPKQQFATWTTYQEHIDYINNNNLCLLGIARNVIIRSMSLTIVQEGAPGVAQVYAEADARTGGFMSSSSYGLTYAFVNNQEPSIATALNSWGLGAGECYYQSTGYITETAPGSQEWECLIFSMGDVYFYGESEETCPPNSTRLNGECVADEGYVWEPETQTFISVCDQYMCFHLPESTLYPICEGEVTGNIILEENTYPGCEKYKETTIYFNYREIYTDGLNDDKRRFLYDAPKSINIDDINGYASFNIENIRSNGRCGKIEISGVSTDPKYRQCEDFIIEICCTDEEAQAGNSCCPNLFDDKFKIWKDCGGFAEPQYVGNVLKDGTILED